MERIRQTGKALGSRTSPGPSDPPAARGAELDAYPAEVLEAVLRILKTRSPHSSSPATKAPVSPDKVQARPTFEPQDPPEQTPEQTGTYLASPTE